MTPDHNPGRVHARELSAVAVSFAYFFCVLAAYYVMRPVREQLAAAVGSTQLPWFFGATFVATLVLTPLFAWLAARYARRVLVPVVYLFFIACLLGFVPLFGNQGLLSPRALGILFFVWVSVFNLFVVSVFWSFMSDIWDERQARRLFPIIGLGGTAGAIAGPALTRSLVGVIGVAPLLVVSATLLGLALACVAWLGHWSRLHGTRRSVADEAAIGGGMFDGLRQVFAHPFMRSMALLMLLGDAIGTVNYALVTDYSGATYHDAVSRTRFAANIDLATNILQVVVQLTLTRWMLVRYGAAAPILRFGLCVESAGGHEIRSVLLSVQLQWPIVLAFGHPKGTAALIAASLAQIGEFSFIIASLGVSLKVTSDFLYPIAVAASAVTTFTTPYLIKLSGPAYRGVERILPEKWISTINRYSTGTQQLSGFSDWKKLLRSYTLALIVHSVILIGIILLSENYLAPMIEFRIGDDLNAGTIVTVLIIFAMMAPFIWALAFRRIQREAYAHLWLNRKLNRGPLIALELMRIGVAIFHVGFLLSIFFSTAVGIVTAILVMVVALLIFRNKLQQFYDRLEKRFLFNLNEREYQRTPRPTIVPWDAHLAEFRVAPEAEIVGKTLQELSFRERFGVNVALIERGTKVITTPGRYEKLYPGDVISVIGTDDQLGRLKLILDKTTLSEPEGESVQIRLKNVTVEEHSMLLNKTIRESGIRETVNALVVGVERNGERILNPESTFRLESGDIMWIVGDTEQIESFLKS